MTQADARRLSLAVPPSWPMLWRAQPALRIVITMFIGKAGAKGLMPGRAWRR